MKSQQLGLIDTEHNISSYIGHINDIHYKELRRLSIKFISLYNHQVKKLNNFSQLKLKFSIKNNVTIKMYGYPVIIGHCINGNDINLNLASKIINVIESQGFVIKVTDCIIIRMKHSYLSKIKNILEVLNNHA